VHAVQLGEALGDRAQVGQQPVETGALAVEAQPYRLGLGLLAGEPLLLAAGERGEERPEAVLQPGDVVPSLASVSSSSASNARTSWIWLSSTARSLVRRSCRRTRSRNARIPSSSVVPWESGVAASSYEVTPVRTGDLW
jgi:hypothetical protein